MSLRSDKTRTTFLVILTIFAVVSGVLIVWMAFDQRSPIALNLATGLMFTLAVAGLIWMLMDPDTHAARQSDELLKLASYMLDCSKEGLSFEAAQQICEALLPATSAMAIALTDREVVLGYAGYNAENNQPGREIRTTATRATLEDGKPRILHRTDDIGLPMSSARINGAVIQPLSIGSNIVGTMKFYYRNANQITKTQESIAHGLAELLSTQMAAAALEEQKKLTTSMELKALQAQINPHFLFNTINTIASFIRTDPNQARTLLREFAVFYRSTLEDASDLIPLEREIQQVQRYLMFEIARFGEDRLQLEVDIDPELEQMYIPSFMIQPLVENAVKHAMRAEGKLTIRISSSIDDENIVIVVSDDGVGMSEETVANMMDKVSTTGLGIAVKNVQDRIRGYFGPDSRMEVTSKVDEGTSISIILNREAAERASREAKELKSSAELDIRRPIAS